MQQESSEAEKTDNQFSWRFLTWLIVANVIIRGLWLAFMRVPQLADFDWYFTHAVQMAQGQGYVWNGHHTAYWPIGWPFFLSMVIRVFGPHVTAGLVVNALLSIGIVILVYLTSLRVFASRTVAMAASIGYTLLPSQVMWNAILGSEELFTFLLMLSLFIYLKTTQMGCRRWLIPVLLSGFVMGFACDVRPIPLVFPLFVLLYEWWIQRRGFVNSILRAVTYFAAMICTVLPVTIRNYLTMHHFVLVSTNGGVNLWQGTKTDGGYYWSWLPWKNPLLKAGTDEVQENQIGTHVATQHILHHPLFTMHHGLLKIIDLYKNDTNPVWYTFHALSNSKTLLYSMDLVSTAAYYLFMILTIIGLYALVKTRLGWKSAVLPLLFVLYNTGVFVFFPAWDRFRYPLMPIFALPLGLGTWYVLRRIQRMRQGRMP